MKVSLKAYSANDGVNTTVTISADNGLSDPDIHTIITMAAEKLGEVVEIQKQNWKKEFENNDD